MKRNLTMLTDLYQMTMLYGYFSEGIQSKEVVFDLFFRKNSGTSAYAIFAGLEQMIDYVNHLRFEAEDLAYLDSLQLFDAKFLEWLRAFRFMGEIYAMPEGSVVFPNEPLVRVHAQLGEAQLLETAMLNIINHQTLIATKASRVVHAAGEGEVLEFGLRRAQGPDAGIYGARAAVIGGCIATSNVMAGQSFGLPVRGTHAHSWVMSFPDELTAFRAYAAHFPDACMLLVDTYDTLQSGVPNAITVFKELRTAGHVPAGIRLDSGDLAYLSKNARAMLDEAGFPEVKIFASNDLDETLIRDLRLQGARIDTWGVGTKLITGGKHPALGGVYKLAAESDGQRMQPRMKLSDTREKMSNPGIKKVIRFYDKRTDKAIADLVALEGERFDESRPLRIYHPDSPWLSKVIDHFYARDLLVPIFVQGKQVYESKPVMALREYTISQLDTFWEEYKRDLNPSVYKVDLSDALYDLKNALIDELVKKDG